MLPSALYMNVRNDLRDGPYSIRLTVAPRLPHDEPLCMSAGAIHETPFGAIRVDASGIVLEHRPLEATDLAAEEPPIVGRDIGSLAPWAKEPAFVSALKSALDSAKVSFHFDFKTATPPRERLIHVNILAVGDKTAWIFITDKTLAMFVT